MHHVTTAPLDTAPLHTTTVDSTAAAAAPDDTDHPAPTHDGRDHAGFHMCLAVLLAAALTLAVWLLLRTARSSRPRPRVTSGPVTGAGRAPPFAATTSTVLSTLCILRV